MAGKVDATTYDLKQALAVKVKDHIEIAIEAEDGTRFKFLATPDKVDALVGDLETSLEGRGGADAA